MFKVGGVYTSLIFNICLICTIHPWKQQFWSFQLLSLSTRKHILNIGARYVSVIISLITNRQAVHVQFKSLVCLTMEGDSLHSEIKSFAAHTTASDT